MPQFYREISRHYHQLFPARQPQLEFLTGLAGAPPARTLDVACGTGEYVAALHALGYDAFGLEIDLHMVQAAQDRHSELARRLVHGDMLELTDELRGPAALAYCIGNSLPHLAGLAEVREAVAQMWDITVPAGKVALQLANFDRVLQAAEAVNGEVEGSVFELPPLSAADDKDGVVRLERRYLVPRRRAGDSAQEVPMQLTFSAELHLAREAHQRSQQLLVLTRERLEACLPREVRVRWYGDFTCAEWSPDSPATICVLGR